MTGTGGEGGLLGVEELLTQNDNVAAAAVMDGILLCFLQEGFCPATALPWGRGTLPRRDPDAVRGTRDFNILWDLQQLIPTLIRELLLQQITSTQHCEVWWKMRRVRHGGHSQELRKVCVKTKAGVSRRSPIPLYL